MSLVLYAASNPAVAAAGFDALRSAGFEAAGVAGADELERALRSLSPAAVVIDLPVLGLDLADLSRLMAGGPRALVCGPPEVAAVVTAPHRFLAQPYVPDDLIAAVRAMVEAPVAGLAFDAATGALTMGGGTVRLTPTEARLFEALVEANGAVVTAEEMVRRAWGYAMDAAAADLLRTHMYQLRQRLARAGLPALIETLPRRGYRLSPPTR